MSIKPKMRNCDGCGFSRVIWKSSGTGGRKLCYACWKLELPKQQSKAKPTRKQKPIPPRSQKRIQQEAEYSTQRKIFLRNNPMCKAHLSGCSQYATEVHHSAGRTESNYLDQSTWVQLCHNCHCWLEIHPTQAKEMGFSKTRL